MCVDTDVDVCLRLYTSVCLACLFICTSAVLCLFAFVCLHIFLCLRIWACVVCVSVRLCVALLPPPPPPPPAATFLRPGIFSSPGRQRVHAVATQAGRDPTAKARFPISLPRPSKSLAGKMDLILRPFHPPPTPSLLFSPIPSPPFPNPPSSP